MVPVPPAGIASRSPSPAAMRLPTSTGSVVIMSSSRRLVQAARDCAGDTERAAYVTKRNLSLKVKGPALYEQAV